MFNTENYALDEYDMLKVNPNPILYPKEATEKGIDMHFQAKLELKNFASMKVDLKGKIKLQLL